AEAAGAAAAEADQARQRAEADRFEAEAARRRAEADAEQARAELTTVAGRYDTLRAQLAAARDAATAAEARAEELTVRLRAAETDRDDALRRTGQLADQVSHLAAALAHLGPRDGARPAG
ncbi:hypothetical protein V6V16_13060, partial [Micromonospora sp. CPCC 205561]